MDLERLRTTAEAMVAPGKGILAMDESAPTCQKRFDALGIPSTLEMRREYRTMFVTTPELGTYIGGAILFDETLRDNTMDGRSFVEVLEKQGIIPGVDLQGIVLKPSMVISGSKCSSRAGIEEVAQETLRCLLSAVPPAVPGIAFLSGGQSDDEATLHLNAINNLADSLPWSVTFSYGRALQAAAMKAWGGKRENFDNAQRIVLHRAHMNGLASQGHYDPTLEKG